jgi:hypothetical protein
MFRLLSMVAAGALALVGCNQSPPSITAITLAPSGSAGQTPDIQLARTRLGAPIPVLGVRSGDDPALSSLMLNEPKSGRVSIQLGIGVQNFLLFAPIEADPRPFTVAIYLDGESAASLGCDVGQTAQTLGAPAAGPLMSNEGTAVEAAPTLSSLRRGFRVSLERCTWPLGGTGIDVVSPWMLQPDNNSDQVGVVRLRVTREP